jgi:hypothetical protein
MVEKSRYEARRIERDELMDDARRQPLSGKSRGRHRAGGDQHRKI